MKRTVKLPYKDWKNPFDELIKELGRPPSNAKKYRLSLAIGDCERHYRYLKAIWRRLESDYDNYGQYLSLMKKYMGNGETNDLAPLDPSFFEEQLEKTISLKMDYESFFIFTNILLNKIAYTVQLFFSKVPNSFSKQKRFFKKPENIPFRPDEDYAKYMREKTRWIEISLKGTRDKLLEHGLTYVSGIKFSFKNQKITLPLLGWGRDLQKATSKLLNLKYKYEERYPQFKKIDNNIYEITNFLLNNSSISLDPDDQKTFFECLTQTGSELPDISSIADNIINYVEFFCDHFLTREQASTENDEKSYS